MGNATKFIVPYQGKFVEKMVDFLTDNPEVSIGAYPKVFAKKKKYILLFESREKYFLLTNHLQFLSENDSLKVDKISVKDSVFVHFLSKKVNGNSIFSIQALCDKFVGSTIVNTRFQQLNKERKDTFMKCFKEKLLKSV